MRNLCLPKIACQAAGLAVARHAVGPMALLNPRKIAQEEGISPLASIGWNMLTQPILRQRILAIRDTFKRHHDDLGYVILCARQKC